MLFNEPKLLKSKTIWRGQIERIGFSALQRAEIAEMQERRRRSCLTRRCFSALQRAEIAEIDAQRVEAVSVAGVSVLFNEPKLLKSGVVCGVMGFRVRFQCSSTSRNC